MVNALCAPRLGQPARRPLLPLHRRSGHGSWRLREIALTDLPDIVGQEVGVSDWVEIDQARVNRCADATDDHQWIHVDV